MKEDEVMSRPTHVLKHEHRVIERALRALDGMCIHLKSGGNVQPEALCQILDFIQNFADRFHHAREETYLFPALGNNGFQKEGGALGFFMGEHETERMLTAELELAIGEYRHGDPAAVDRFVEAANLYRDHMVGHMREEDTILFRLAEEVLDETVKASLTQSFAQEEAQSSEGMVARYERLAQELEKNWAV
ncbi:MAG TPA: hemerythrin domain-containing protein [Blastocatellia bacterium]|nr:hemerythrin domain-containing protein [Blastocatellia bacterium]